MTIGIIGSGAIGTAFARALARAGIEATISNSRGPESLKELVQELGPLIKAGTREEGGGGRPGDAATDDGHIDGLDHRRPRSCRGQPATAAVRRWPAAILPSAATSRSTSAAVL